MPRRGSADIIRSGGKRSFALRTPVCLFTLLVFLATACGNGGDRDASSRSQSQPDDAQEIRGVDFETLGATEDLIGQLGTGAVEPDAIVYADLTGDQREEAIVPVTSQGTLGNVGYLVFALKAGKPEVVLTRTVDRTSAGGLQMSVEEGVLLETRGVFGPDDPFCCPSQLRETTFGWDGSQLQVDNEVLVQQDPGPKRSAD